jgi:hypothetical protein
LKWLATRMGALAVLCLAPHGVAVWPGPGQMLSAAIAYHELPPALRAEVVCPLRTHPRWVPRGAAPSGVEPVALFLAAAC